jgi:hypothetical protein
MKTSIFLIALLTTPALTALADEEYTASIALANKMHSETYWWGKASQVATMHDKAAVLRVCAAKIPAPTVGIDTDLVLREIPMNSVQRACVAKIHELLSR